MKRSRMVSLLVTIFLAAIVSPRAEVQTPFSITAIVKNSPQRKAQSQEIEVEAKVRNVSTRSETFVVTGGCRWIFWKTDNSTFSISGHEACLSNCPYPVTLKPSEEYSEKIFVSLDKKLKPGLVSFRVGFTPNQKGKDLLNSGRAYPTMWSNLIKFKFSGQ